MKISAIIVTRGDVDLSPCLSAIDADEIVTPHGRRGVWERWKAAAHAKHDVIYVQDDDAVVDFKAVVAAYDPRAVVCNMPMRNRSSYQDGIALVGWGTIFHRSMLAAFDRYRVRFPVDALFRREADRVFTGLNRCKLIDVPFRHLPAAYDRSRLSFQRQHLEALRAIRERIYAVRGSADTHRTPLAAARATRSAAGATGPTAHASSLPRVPRAPTAHARGRPSAPLNRDRQGASIIEPPRRRD